jgi:hypothetical protein
MGGKVQKYRSGRVVLRTNEPNLRHRMASKTGIVVQFGGHRATRWHCVGIPVTALLFQYIVWRAALKTLWNDGIDWRGTHYPLQELKANKV